MPKPNLKRLLTSLLALVVFATLFFSGLKIHVSADVCSADRGTCTSTTSTSSAKLNTNANCNPDKDWYCKGLCDTSITKGIQSHPEIAKDAQKVSSCKCDGTPNLDTGQLKACQACTAKANQIDANGASSSAVDGNCLKNNPIVIRINQIVNFLAGLVAIVVTGTMIVGGIQYTLAGDKADQSAAAKKRIVNGLIALITFILIYSLLQWHIPGGIFR